MSERNTKGYVENKLKEALARELEYIEERTRWEKRTKEEFGRRVYEGIKEKNEAREQALLFSDQGEKNFKFILLLNN